MENLKFLAEKQKCHRRFLWKKSKITETVKILKFWILAGLMGLLLEHEVLTPKCPPSLLGNFPKTA
jgi:hypothetical protein